MTSPAVQTLNFQSLTIPEGWLFAPTSFLTDRIVPAPERVFLPQAVTGGGTLEISTGSHVFRPPAPDGRLKKLTARKARRDELPGDAPVLDLRHGHPQNWAHFLNNHLALLAFVARATDRKPTDFRLLLPEKTPSYVTALATLLGLTVLCTDAEVSAFGVSASVPDWNVIRGERYGILTDARCSPVMAALQDGRIDTTELPGKVFLSRRSTRALRNEGAVDEMLSSAGYTKIYMEDLSVSQQIAVGHSATHVVAVHGAALAPFFYRRSDGPQLKLIELFPVGHMTNVFRAMAAAQSGIWAGVRGHIEPQHLKEIYRSDGKPYFTHSLDPFSVDLASIQLALEVADADAG